LWQNRGRPETQHSGGFNRNSFSLVRSVRVPARGRRIGVAHQCRDLSLATPGLRESRPAK